MSTQLVKYDAARMALQVAHSVDEAKEIRDKMEGLRAYARQAHDIDMEIWAAEIKLRARRRIGELSAELEKAVKPGPGRGKKGRDSTVVSFSKPGKTETLKSAEVHPREAQRCEQLAQIPEDEFEEYIRDKKEKGKAPSAEEIMKGVIKKRKKAAREAELARQKADIETGKVVDVQGPFDVLCIDPPWPYGTKYDAGGRRSANPYPEMSLEEIAALSVAEKAAPDAFLWLWTTHKFMRHSFPLLDAWGFEEKAILTWVKDKMGTGHWLRSQSEFCILAVRGKPKVHLTNQTTVIHGPLREHSRKPDEFYALVEGLCIGDRRYDWFSREQRPGWVSGGNDTEKF